MEEYQGVFRRVEKKYMMTKKQYLTLLPILEKHMVRDRYGSHIIENVYFDTEDYAIIRRSLTHPVYKEKLRMRCYGLPTGDDKVFLEIKKKFKGVVYKRRIEVPLSVANAFRTLRDPIAAGFVPRTRTEAQIAGEIAAFVRTWNCRPRAFIAYRRFGMECPTDPDLRITFDTEIRYRGDDLQLGRNESGRMLLEEDTVLMEVKLHGAIPQWLADGMSRCHIERISFSKYGRSYEKFVK